MGPGRAVARPATTPTAEAGFAPWALAEFLTAKAGEVPNAAAPPSNSCDPTSPRPRGAAAGDQGQRPDEVVDPDGGRVMLIGLVAGEVDLRDTRGRGRGEEPARSDETRSSVGV